MIRDRIDATMAFCCVNRNSLCADAAMTHAEIIADAHPRQTLLHVAGVSKSRRRPGERRKSGGNGINVSFHASYESRMRTVGRYR